MKGYVWLVYYLVCSIMDLADTIEVNPCTSAASRFGIPIVQFCENNQAGNEVVLMMDGYAAESITTVNSCSCIITTSYATKLNFINSVSVPLVITPGCGSDISIQNSQDKILMGCKIEGSIDVRTDEHLNVILTQKSSNADTRYCVHIHQGDGSAKINATCFKGILKDITSTSTTYVTESLPDQISTNSHISTDDLSTKTQFSMADTSRTRTSDSQLSTPTSTIISTNYTRDAYNRTNENIVTISTGADMIMYYAIGGGGGGVVAVIIVVVTVVLCKRCSPKKSKKNERSNEDDADDLQYNMLYVSSDNTDIDTNTVDRHGLSQDTEATYSTVDIEETEFSNDKHLNQNYDLPNIKTTFLPATLITHKSLVSESEDKATVQKSSVTHGIVPGGGSEYAVVNKQEKNNVTDSVWNTYAVVNKTWK